MRQSNEIEVVSLADRHSLGHWHHWLSCPAVVALDGVAVMTARRATTVDAWPPRMNADMAASYCGEKHVEDFLKRVGIVYPGPKWVESTRRKFWYRGDLDRSLGLVETVSSGLGERFREVRKKRHG